MPISILNPWVILTFVLTLAAAAGGGYVKGEKDCQATQTERKLLIEEVAKEAQKATAEAISKVEIRNTTIRQKVEREVHEVPIYNDCRNSTVGLQLLNSALSGAGDNGTGNRKLPRILGGAD